MRNLPIQTATTKTPELIAPSISQELNENLHAKFEIPKLDKFPESDTELLQAIGGLLINYHALYLELRDTPLRVWIDENLSGFYFHNANNPTEQAIEKLSDLIKRTGGENA